LLTDPDGRAIITSFIGRSMMASTKSVGKVFRFGRFEANVARNTLLGDGIRVRIHDQPFRVLILLLEQAGEIVTREELRQHLWPEGIHVDFDGSLNAILKKLRTALGDDAEKPRFVETAPRQGYRFIAPVTMEETPSTVPAVPAPPVFKTPAPPSAELTQPNAIAGSLLLTPWYAAALAIVIVALAGTGWFTWRKRHFVGNLFDISLSANAHMPVRRSVAVLGFHNASGRSDDAWLSTALSEMLSTELAGGDKLRLVSGEDVANLRVSSPWPQADSLDQASAARVGTALNSDLLVLGSYTSIGQPDRGEIRLDVRLQEAKTGEILTGISQTGGRQDMFRFVSNVGAKLRDKLGVPQLQEPEQAGVSASMPLDRDAARFYALGITKLRDFDALAAKDLFEQACKADPKFALGHVMLARAWGQLGYEQQRKEEAKKALDLSATLPAAERLQVEGDYYEALADHDKAASAFHALFELFPDSIEYGLQLALAQQAAGHGIQSVETLRQLRRLPPPGSEDPRIDLAEERSIENNKPAALVLIRNAVRKASAQGKKLIYARAKKEECMALIYGDNPDAGVPACEEAEQIYLAAGNRVGAADALRLIADRQGSAGHYEQAIATYQHALDVLQGLGEHLKTGAVLNNMAGVFLNQGKVDHAGELYKQALSHFEEGGEKYDAAITVSNVADTFYLRGNLKDAEKEYQKAIALNAQLDHGDAGYPYYRLADLKLAEGQVAEARRLAQRAIDDLAPVQGGYDSLTGAMIVLGEALDAAGDMAGAREQFEKTLTIRKKMGSLVLVSESQVELADLEMDEGHPREAESLFREAISEFEKEHSDPDSISAFTGLSRALLMQGKIGEGQKAIRHASELARTTSDPALQLQIAIQSARVDATPPEDSAADAAPPTQARQKLRTAAATAHKLGYYRLECEARLALAELETRVIPAKPSNLSAFATEVRGYGLEQLARRADRLEATTTSTFAANNRPR
jgi:DNA-binding winged helix-turn-helix (wHTH) protein/tetratricopeptide (TPR) repeat protein/TolB-like protein